VLVQHHCRASDVASLLDPPKTNVFFATADESEVVHWAKFEAENVELGSLSSKDLRLFIAVNF
jgi:hypothetical protein